MAAGVQQIAGQMKAVKVDDTVVLCVNVNMARKGASATVRVFYLCRKQVAVHAEGIKYKLGKHPLDCPKFFTMNSDHLRQFGP